MRFLLPLFGLLLSLGNALQAQQTRYLPDTTYTDAWTGPTTGKMGDFKNPAHYQDSVREISHYPDQPLSIGDTTFFNADSTIEEHFQASTKSWQKQTLSTQVFTNNRVLIRDFAYQAGTWQDTSLGVFVLNTEFENEIKFDSTYTLELDTATGQMDTSWLTRNTFHPNGQEAVSISYTWDTAGKKLANKDSTVLNNQGLPDTVFDWRFGKPSTYKTFEVFHYNQNGRDTLEEKYENLEGDSISKTVFRRKTYNNQGRMTREETFERGPDEKFRLEHISLRSYNAQGQLTHKTDSILTFIGSDSMRLDNVTFNSYIGEGDAQDTTYRKSYGSDGEVFFGDMTIREFDGAGGPENPRAEYHFDWENDQWSITHRERFSYTTRQITSLARRQKSAFKLYPNPTSGPITLEHEPFQNARKYRLLSQTGRLVRQGSLEAGTQSQQLNFDKLPTGQYFLQVVGQDQVQTHRLVIE